MLLLRGILALVWIGMLKEDSVDGETNGDREVRDEKKGFSNFSLGLWILIRLASP